MNPVQAILPGRTIAATAGALLLIAAQTALADRVDRSFQVNPGGTVRAYTDLGSFTVRSGSGNTVEVKVTREGRSEEYLELTFEQSGDDISITGENTRGDHGWGRGNSVHFDIRVPQRYNVDITTAGGSIEIDDLQGEVEAETAGGSLSFGRIEGQVYGRTSGGSISLDGTDGDVDVSTSGGSIKIGDVGGHVMAHTSGGSIDIGNARGKVDARTSGGSIRVEEATGGIEASTSGGSITAYLSQQPGGDSRLTTSGGTVTAYLADNLALDIDARSYSARVQSDFELGGATSERYEKRRSRLRGELNGGGPRLELEATGNVRIRRR